MFFIIIIIVVIALFISNKNSKETMPITGEEKTPEVQHDTKIDNIDSISIAKIEENTKTIYLITASEKESKDCKNDVKDIINTCLKNKKDSMLIVDETTNIVATAETKDRIFINKDDDKKKLIKDLKDKKIEYEDNIDVMRIATTSYGKIIIYKKLQDIEIIKTESKKVYPEINLETYNNPIPNEILDTLI